MHLIFLGPPGAGKGTQSEFIVKQFGIPHISTGDMFRAAIKEGTEAGKLAQSYIDRGALCPDDVTIKIVKERLSEDDCKKGFLLDGFPRTIEQAIALKDILKDLNIPLQAVLNLELDNNKIIDRIVGRRICSSCGQSYHITNNPSKVEGICDKCGSPLYTRKDDNEGAVKTRLEAYNKQTYPLIVFYKNEGILVSIDADRDIKEISQNIYEILKEVK